MSQAGSLGDGGTVLPDIETLTGNAGGAVGPDAAFNIDILGNNTQGINIVGTPGSNLLTVSGINSSTVQIGVVELATDAETIAGVDAIRANTPASLAAKLGAQTSSGLPIGAGTASAITWTAAPTNGQVLIGSTGVDPVLNTITGGSGITVTNGAGSITISTTTTPITVTCGTGTTVNFGTADLVTLDLGGSAALFSFRVIIGGKAATASGIGGQIVACVRTDGAVATLVETPDIINNSDLVLAGASFTIIASGNNAIVRATGALGTVISWSACLESINIVNGI